MVANNLCENSACKAFDNKVRYKNTDTRRLEDTYMAAWKLYYFFAFLEILVTYCARISSTGERLIITWFALSPKGSYHHLYQVVLRLL